MLALTMPHLKAALRIPIPWIDLMFPEQEQDLYVPF